MARIRSIKPEFPQSESIGKLSRDARLLFILIWTHVDDEGRARAASRMLASLLFPYDEDAPKLVGHWLDELEQNGFIRRYQVDGSKYLEVVNWLKHQKIDHPSKSKIPPFSEGSRNPRETLANPRENSRSLAPDRDLGIDLGKKDSVLSDGRPAVEAEPALEFEILPPAETPEVALFRTGKRLLGKSAGGQINKLLMAAKGDVAKAQEAINLAAAKQDPAEYIAACIRKASTGPPRPARVDHSANAAAELLENLRANTPH